MILMSVRYTREVSSVSGRNYLFLILFLCTNCLDFPFSLYVRMSFAFSFALVSPLHFLPKVWGKKDEESRIDDGEGERERERGGVRRRWKVERGGGERKRKLRDYLVGKCLLSESHAILLGARPR